MTSAPAQSTPGARAGAFERECRACAARVAMKWIYSEKGFEILQCPRCDFVTTDPVPGAAELEKFYSQHFLKGDAADAEFWRAPRERVFAQIRALLARHGLKRDGRYLDIGCAYGAFLSFMKQSGYEHPCGVDLSTPAVEHLKHTLGFEAWHGTVRELRLPERSVDAVTMIDTFEHLPDFKETLLEVRRVLKPGGVAVIRVPNMNFHLPKAKALRRLRMSWKYGVFTPPGHLNHFTPRGLANLLELSNMGVAQAVNGVPAIYGAWSRRAGLRVAHGAAQLLRALTFGRYLCGTSLVMVARVE